MTQQTRSRINIKYKYYIIYYVSDKNFEKI